MNEQIKELLDKSTIVCMGIPEVNQKQFAELIIQECIDCCGSQADRKNIRKRFGLPIESNVKYEAPEAHGSITSQYTREYNIPK